MKGTVYLIGAGLGDAGLLTIRGKNLLEQADCVIYDRLGTEQVLRYVPQNCEKINVGKANKNHTMPQEQINRLLEQKAKQYQTVVRLKGGDPFVFGRGSEEILHLSKAGIPFEVVSGITSAVAGLAFGGIPITHRTMAQGFRVYTAHDKTAALPPLDFASMASTNDTLVFLMGLSQCELIAEKLLQEGKPPKTPVAVVSQASLPTQTSVVCTLDCLAQTVAQSDIKSPAVIAVGQTVSLAPICNWFERRPLFGKKILFAQTGSDSRLPQLLQQQGAQVQTVQVSVLQAVPQAWQNICSGAGAEWVAFTSRNGVRFFFDAVRQNGQDSRCLGGTMVAAIGTATAEELQKNGIKPDFVTNGTAEEFARQLSQEMLAGERLLLICPKQPLADCWNLPHNPVIAAFVYENLPNPDAKLPQQLPDGAVFTCASSVHRAAALENGKTMLNCLQNIPVVAIGQKTAQALQEYGITPQICEQTTYEQVVDCLCQQFEKNNR